MILQVCGNDESVNFLSEWLRLWYKRDFRASKEPTGSGNCDRQFNDYSCSQSDSDLESETEEASMKKNNVLLVTGPIGVYTNLYYPIDLLEIFDLILVSIHDFLPPNIQMHHYGAFS